MHVEGSAAGLLQVLAISARRLRWGDEGPRQGWRWLQNNSRRHLGGLVSVALHRCCGAEGRKHLCSQKR